MRAVVTAIIVVLSLTWGGAKAAGGAAVEQRLGLVIGNTSYLTGAQATAANDAGLVAKTLRTAGFDVTGARDLDGEGLGRAFREFSDKVARAGLDAVVVIYLAGQGLQYGGNNYFLGVDSKADASQDAPARAVGISEQIRLISAVRPKALVVILDTARETPVVQSHGSSAVGMAFSDASIGTIIAINATPGTIAQTESGNYGTYARALVEMIREGGLPLDVLFDRVRLRVNQQTGGAMVPWHAGQVNAPFEFFERSLDAPLVEASHVASQRRQQKPIKDFESAERAYFAALERDTLSGYEEFLDAHIDSGLAQRVNALVAVRREAVTWHRARSADRPNAYWSYLERYPDGQHRSEARRRLQILAAATEPPLSYTSFKFEGLRPPVRQELKYIGSRRELVFSGSVLAAVPPCPIDFLPPSPQAAQFPKPTQPTHPHALPVAADVPLASYIRPARDAWGEVSGSPTVSNFEHVVLRKAVPEPVRDTAETTASFIDTAPNDTSSGGVIQVGAAVLPLAAGIASSDRPAQPQPAPASLPKAMPVAVAVAPRSGAIGSVGSSNSARKTNSAVAAIAPKGQLMPSASVGAPKSMITPAETAKQAQERVKREQDALKIMDAQQAAQARADARQREQTGR